MTDVLQLSLTPGNWYGAVCHTDTELDTVTKLTWTPFKTGDASLFFLWFSAACRQRTVSRFCFSLIAAWVSVGSSSSSLCVCLIPLDSVNLCHDLCLAGHENTVTLAVGLFLFLYDCSNSEIFVAGSCYGSCY